MARQPAVNGEFRVEGPRDPISCRPAVRLLAALLVACGVASVPVSAQQHDLSAESYLWRPVAIGGGGFITGYDADPTGRTRVIRADVYGAYLWVAEENRWAQLITASTMPPQDRRQNGIAEGVYEIAVAPSDPNRIYMVTHGHMYRSDDRGRTFAQVSRGAPFPLDVDPNDRFRMYGSFIAVSPTNPDLIFLGTAEKGLLRSQDGGRSWTIAAGVPVERNGKLKDRKGRGPGILPWFERGPGGVPTGRIWAMSAELGGFVSADSGASFAPLVPSEQIQPRTLKQGAFAPDGSFFGVDNVSGTVWRFRSGAWSDLGDRRGMRTGRLGSIAVNPGNGDIYTFEEGGRAQLSTDGGESWQALSHRSRPGEGEPPWLHVSNQSFFATSRVVFDPSVPNRLINPAGTGLYHADVGDRPRQLVWTSETRGIEELVANDVVKPPGQAALFASWDFGIHRREDLNSFSTGYGPKERVLIAAQQLDWSASDPAFIVTNASDTRTSCCWQDGDAVLAGYSRDGGRSWSKFPRLPTPPGTKPEDPWRMSFGTIAVSSGDTANIVWEPSFNRSPFYTKDRGASWQRVVLPGETLPFTGSHAQYYFHRKTLAADRVRSGVFYLYHSGEGQNRALLGLWRTEDGGENWSKIFDREIAPRSQFSAKLRAVPGRAGHLFFTSGVDSGGDMRLRRSRDGGASWTVLARIQQVDDIAFGKPVADGGYPTIFLSGKVDGDYGIWRSTDDAESWRRVAGFPIGTLDQVTVMEADKDVFGRVFVGYKGSGWRYGEPAACKPEPASFPRNTECSAVR